LVYDTDTPTTIFTLTTDYTVDSQSGRIKVVEGGAIDTGNANITVRYHRAAATYTQIASFANTTITGFLRFVSDNPVGSNKEVKIWSVDLTPSGDWGLISDDWQTMEYTFEILKDETNHPTSPYMDILEVTD
jgi:hypothetical protein